MAFTPERLLTTLGAWPPPGRYLAAFSGGLDSTVLLHGLAQLRPWLPAPIAAVHVDHGWSPHSAEWAEQCASFCRALSIPCLSLRIDATVASGESREAAARRARYAALRSQLQPGEMLLTAHQQDDQAETLLLQLLRGAGVRGLAAMPQLAPLGTGLHARPLLDATREELAAYAAAEGLAWIEDPSNFDVGFDRNRLRQEVIPLLRARWPALGRTLARSAGHMAEASGLLDDLAADDLAGACGRSPGTLAASRLMAMSAARARNLVRFWIRQRGLPVPDAPHLERILREGADARPDAEPLIAWRGAEVRRYRDDLHANPPLAAVPPVDLPWQPAVPLVIPGLGTLSAEPVLGGGVRADLPSLTVRFGVPGEVCRPAGREGHQSLRKLYQAADVPPWERRREPMVYFDRRLVAVADRWICDEFAAQTGEPGLQLRWQR